MWNYLILLVCSFCRFLLLTLQSYFHPLSSLLTRRQPPPSLPLDHIDNRSIAHFVILQMHTSNAHFPAVILLSPSYLQASVTYHLF